MCKLKPLSHRILNQTNMKYDIDIWQEKMIIDLKMYK